MATKPNPRTAASANKNLVNYTNKTTNYIDKTFKYPNQTYTVITNGITGQTQTVSGIVPGSTKVKGSDGTYHYVANPNTQYGSTTNPYMDQLQTVNQNIQNQNEQQKAYLQNLYNTNSGQINQTYDRSANNAYVDYRQNQKDLKDQMSTMGVTGGASETARIKLQNSYGSALQNNETSRSGDLTNAYNNYMTNSNAADTQMYSDLNDAQSEYMSKATDYETQKLSGASDAAEAAYNESVAQVDAKRAAYIKNRNAQVDTKKASLRAAGYTLATSTDANGLHHYTIVKKPTTTSGGSNSKNSRAGGKSSSGSSSSGGSYGVLNNVSNDNKGKDTKDDKPKDTKSNGTKGYNLQKIGSFINSNMTLIMTGKQTKVIAKAKALLKAGKLSALEFNTIASRVTSLKPH